jgi:hypothetical protein
MQGVNKDNCAVRFNTTELFLAIRKYDATQQLRMKWYRCKPRKANTARYAGHVVGCCIDEVELEMREEAFYFEWRRHIKSLENTLS